MLRYTLLLALSFVSLTVVPAYAEVTSLQTDRSLYSIDMSIYFTGTVSSTDSQKLVNLMIQDPDGKIILMTGKYADSNNTFQIIVNTADPSQFSLKGTYSASAFVDSKQSGETITFDFSPDGSPVSHTSESSGVIPSQNEMNNTNQETITNNNKSPSNENITIVDSVTASKKTNVTLTPSDLPTSSPQLTNVFYPLMVVGGAGLVGFILYQKKKKGHDVSKQSEESSIKNKPDKDYALTILKNRLAKGEITLEEFKMTRDALSEP